MEAIQGGADMQGGGGNPAANLIPFGSPTQNPGEPVTAGADLGAGMGPAAAGISSDSTATLEQMAPLLRSLKMVANLPNSTPETVSFVRALEAKLSGRG
jgi:hypothetical protein